MEYAETGKVTTESFFFPFYFAARHRMCTAAMALYKRYQKEESHFVSDKGSRKHTTK